MMLPTLTAAHSRLASTPVSVPTLHLIRTLDLQHGGDCALIGVDRDGRVAVDEYYEDWLARYVFEADGTLSALADEDYGATLDPQPMPDLADFGPPPPIGEAAALNYAGSRWRGLREEEWIADLAQPLTVSERMALAAFQIPGTLLGIAESYVLAEAPIRPDLSLICRRLRIAYAVTPPRLDATGQPYDYDTQAIFVTQWYDPAEGVAPLDRTLPALAARPTDLLVRDGRLFVADSGDPQQAGHSAVHIYEIGA